MTALFVSLIFFLPLDAAGFPLPHPMGIGPIDVALIVIAALAIIRGISGGRIALSIRSGKLILLLVFSFVFSLVSLVYVSSARLRLDINLSANLIELAVLIASATLALRTENAIRLAVFASLLSSLVLAFLTIAKGAGLDVPGYSRELQFVAGGVTFGGVAIVDSILPFSISVLTAVPALLLNPLQQKFVVRALLIIILIFASVISMSRTLWLALLAETVFFVLLQITRSRVPGRIYQVLFLGGALVTIGVLYGQETYETLTILRPTTVDMRTEGYAIAWELLSDQPQYSLWGYGKGAFVDVIEQRLGEVIVAHNFVIDLLVSKGVFVLCAILLVLGILSFSLIRIIRNPSSSTFMVEFGAYFLVTLYGIVACGMFAPIFNAVNFWVVLAVTAAFINVADRA